MFTDSVSLKLQPPVPVKSGTVSVISLPSAHSQVENDSFSSEPSQRKVSAKSMLSEMLKPGALAGSKRKKRPEPKREAEGLDDGPARLPAFMERALVKIRQGVKPFTPDAEPTATQRLQASRKEGQFRTTDELNPTMVAQALREQQAVIQASDVDELVLNFREADQPLALLLLERMSRWGSMNSLNSLQQTLVQHGETMPVICEAEGTLGSTLNYLTAKHAGRKNLALPSPFANKSVHCGSSQSLKNSAMVLDESLLRQLEISPKLKERIRQGNVRLLYPDGWIEGVNPFNQLSIEALGVKLESLLREGKRLQRTEQLKPEAAADKALSEPTRQALRKLGLDEQLEVIPYKEHTTPSLTKKKDEKLPETTSEKIARQLAPDTLTGPELRKLLKGFESKEHRQAALEVLAQEAEIFSPLRMSLTAQRIELSVQQKARQLGISSENVYYYLGKKGKSFGLVSMQHLTVNQIPHERLIQHAGQIRNPEKSLLVVLDDVAGSGMSLREMRNKVRLDGYQGKVLVAPIISTTRADQMFREMRAEDPDCFYQPGQVLLPFRDNELYRSLPGKQRKVISEVAGHLGCDENGLNVVFPYMGPDNNNAFFSDKIAPAFILNRAARKNMDEEFSFPERSKPLPTESSQPRKKGLAKPDDQPSLSKKKSDEEFLEELMDKQLNFGL